MGNENSKSSQDKKKFQSNHSSAPKTNFDISALLELSNKESGDVIKYVKDHLILFKNTIQEPLSSSTLVVLMKIIRKICLVNFGDDKVNLLKTICCDNFLNFLNNYIRTLPSHQDSAKENVLFLEENVLIFFETIWLLIPSLVCVQLQSLLRNANIAINNLEQYQNVKFDSEIKFKFKKLESDVIHRYLKKSLDISTLLKLSNKESSDVIKYMTDNLVLFKNTIQDSLSTNLLIVLMEIIRKICLANYSEDKVNLLKIICCDNFLNYLCNYLGTLPSHEQNCANEDVLFLEGNVLIFFETVYLLIPSVVCVQLQSLLRNTNIAIINFELYKNVKFDCETKMKFKKLESDIFLRLNNSSSATATSTTTEQGSAQAPTTRTTSGENGQNIKTGQAYAKHLFYVTSKVFPDVIKKLDVPAHKVQGVCKNIFFIDRDWKDGGFVKEIQFLLYLVKYLLKQKYKTDNILLLTTNEIKMKHIVEIKDKDDSLKDVNVGVLNNYENINVPIVLITFAVSESEDVKNNIYDERQICKVLLGAKNGIFMTGNFAILEKQSSFWKELKCLLQQHQAVSPELPLFCEAHQMIVSVSDITDFKKVKNGGCLRRCEQKLSCGHHCRRQCHFDDRNHKKYKCHERCSRKPDRCSMNHVCPKLCYEKCDLCSIAVEINNSMMQCHELLNDQYTGKSSAMQSDAENGKASLLPCGHISSNESRTGQQLDLWSIELVNLCQVPCNAVLQCGHTCTGTCGSCRQGRVHIPCRDNKKITLACGHRLSTTCSAPVEQCNKKCFYECPHGKCKENCGVACTPCQEMCTLGCAHTKCTKKCFEVCDRSPCSLPCKKSLACGHQCLGFCGEPCPPGPQYCRVCSPEKMKKWDSSGKARFVFLINCKHVVRSRDLDLKVSQKPHKVEALACPICGFNITKTTRYLNYAKELHINLYNIRCHHKEYNENLSSTFLNISKEILSFSLPTEIEYHPKMGEIKTHFKSLKDKKFADQKGILLLMFLRNLLHPVVAQLTGMTSPNHLDWYLYLLLERYEMGLCSEVVRELYKEIIDYQKLKGTVYKQYLLELHKAIAFFVYLEKNTWFKCYKNHLSPYNSMLTECTECDAM